MTDQDNTKPAAPRTEAEINDIISAVFTEDRRAAFDEIGIDAVSVENGARAALQHDHTLTEEKVGELLDRDIKLLGDRKRKQEEAEAAHRAEVEAAEAEAAAAERRSERIAVAGMALQGMLANPQTVGSAPEIVRMAVDFADLLLATVDQQSTQH